jgi:RHS repeat-associated protein
MAISKNYSPFGKVAVSGTQSDNPYKFTAREDDNTGFYYYRARYYSPEQKRFISEDPLGFGGGDTNIQAYVGNNPVNSKDPSGKQAELVEEDAIALEEAVVANAPSGDFQKRCRAYCCQAALGNRTSSVTFLA